MLNEDNRSNRFIENLKMAASADNGYESSKDNIYRVEKLISIYESYSEMSDWIERYKIAGVDIQTALSNHRQH